MSHLAKLTLSAKSPRQKLSPVDRKKQKLLAQLDQQIAAVEAELNGSQLTEHVKRWEKIEGSNEKQLVTKQLPVRKWWWKSELGQVMFSLRVGNRVFEVESGKPAIEVGKLEELPGILQTLREAIVAGEVDKQLEKATTRLNGLETKVGKTGKPG